MKAPASYHTPGPWHVRGSQYIEARICAGDDDIAHLAVNVESVERGMANLYLLAAAPDVLAALVVVTTVLQSIRADIEETYEELHLEARAALAQANAAIVRATGGAA